MDEHDLKIPYIPDGAELTREILIAQEERFMALFDEIMECAAKFDVTLRVIGSLAFRLKCPDYKYMEYENLRYLTDIDFIAYSEEIVRVQDMFFDMNWAENQSVLQMFGDKRRIFYHPTEPIHSDIFIDKLRFCHEVDFRKRLEIDYPTISLVDLLLEKLQIVEINKKDLVDVMVLLSQHPIGNDGRDKEFIDGAYLAQLCSYDWGWWRTATINIEKTKNLAGEYLDENDADKVREKLEQLSMRIDEQSKSIKWKLRSKIGDKVKWYREVEEVQRD